MLRFAVQAVTRGSHSCATRRKRERTDYIFGGLPLSVVFLIWVRDELGSSERYVQGRQRQVSVGKADQLDWSSTLVVLLHLLGYDLQLWGSSMGRSPATQNTQNDQKCTTIRELRWWRVDLYWTFYFYLVFSVQYTHFQDLMLDITINHEVLSQIITLPPPLSVVGMKC